MSRLTEAVHRQVPQLRYARAERRGVERAAGEVAQQYMKTLRVHGFNQRPRFEQVVGYLERNEPLLDQPDRKATGRFWRGPQPPAPAAHAPASRGRLPHSRRGHARGRAACAEVPRVRNPLC